MFKYYGLCGPVVPLLITNVFSFSESGTCSKGLDASVSQKSVSEIRPDKEPVEGAVEQHKSLDSHPDCAGSSLGCLKHAIEQLSQHDAPSHEAESSLGCLTQVPSTQVPTLVH